MSASGSRGAAILGVCLLVGMGVLGYLLGSAALRVKSLERTVTVKGLAEREVPADVAIWPATFRTASNDLGELFDDIQIRNVMVVEFLRSHGIEEPGDEISISAPEVTDLHAQNYGNRNEIAFRYTAMSTVTVHTRNIDAVRAAMADVITLGKRGVALSGENYQKRTQFLFTGLSDIKPGMVEEATRNARAVAEKFAEDSESVLGKIKTARQGQFSIQDRDATTPHIKKVRVVSTIQYYLSD